MQRPLIPVAIVVALLSANILGLVASGQLPGLPNGASGQEQIQTTIQNTLTQVGAPPGTDQRALQDAVAQGYTDAVPPDAATPSPLYTAAVQALVTGALEGADANTAAGMTDAQRDLAQGAAQGFAGAAFATLPANPSNAQDVLLQAVAEGMSAGAAKAADDFPQHRAQDYQGWASAVGAHLVSWSTSAAQQFPTPPTGSQLDALTAWVDGTSRGVLGHLPNPPTQAQLDAAGTWAGAFLQAAEDGIAAGDVPTSVPTPLVDAMQAYARGVAEGATDGMPRNGPVDADAFTTYMTALATGLPGRIADLDTTPSQQAIGFLQAWGTGLAQDAPTWADPDGFTKSGDVGRAVRTYAQRLAEDGAQLMENASGWGPDRIAAAQAWAHALSAGVQDLGAAGGQDTVVVHAYLDGLSAAVLDFPPAPYQDQIDAMSAFGKGAATSGIDMLTRNAAQVAEPPNPDFVRAVADGVRAGAALLGVQVPPADPGLVENFSRGLVAGTLDPQNPFELERNVTQAGRLTTAYLNGSTEGFLGGLYRNAWGTVADPGNLVLAAAHAMTAPAWALLDERLDRGQLAAGEAHAWGQGTAAGLQTALGNAADRIAHTDPAELTGWVDNLQPNLDRYMAEVLAHAYPPPDLGDVGAENTTRAVENFAGVLTAPVAWLPSVDPNDPLNDAYAQAIGAFAGHVRADSEAFLDDASVAGIDAIVDGLSSGLARGLEVANFTGPQGNATKAWAMGVGDAITNAPLPTVDPDTEGYRSWAENLTLGASGAAVNGTLDQLQAAQDLANATLGRILGGTPPGLPPLLVADWAKEYANGTVSGLPDLMTDAQERAILAWANGTFEAITHPPLDPGALTQEQYDATTAYVTAVAAAAGHVPAQGPDPQSVDPGDVSQAYLDAAMNATKAFQPSQDALDSIRAWANATALGMAAMAGPHAQAALDFADEVANATQTLPPLQGGQLAILTGYAGGLLQGLDDLGVLYVPDPQPGQPPSPPDPNDWQQVNAVINGVRAAASDLRNLTLPHDAPLADQVDRVDGLVHFAVFGGVDAVWATHDASLGDSEALYLWTMSYVATGMRTVVEPLLLDQPAMQQYVEGSMHEGAARILALQDLPADQLPGVQASAEAVANMSQERLFKVLGANSTDWYQYGADLAQVVQETPTQPTARQLDAMQAWIGTVRDAAVNLSTAPSEQAAQNVHAWIAAESDAIAHASPPAAPPVNVTWEQYVDAVSAYLDGLTSSGLWDLANLPPGPDPRDDAGWVRDSVLAAITGACTGEFPATCAQAERIAGSATGHDIARDAQNLTDPSKVPGAQQVHDTLVAAAQDVLRQVPAPSPSEAVAIVTGAAEPLLKQAPQGPAQSQLDAALAAAHAAAGNVPGTVADPAGAAQAIAASISRELPRVQPAPSDPGQLRGWADASARASSAWLVAHGAPADPAALADQVAGVVRATLGTGPAVPGVTPSVTLQASDGNNTLGDAQLDGTRSLRSDVRNGVDVAIPPTVDAPQAVWQLAVSLGPFDLASAQRIALTKGTQGYHADIGTDLLSGAADGTVLHLEVVRTLPAAGETPYTKDGQPWAYKLDRAPPTFQLTVPAQPSAAQFTLVWTAGDGNGAGVDGVTIDVAKDGGAYTHLVQDTGAASAQFQGEAGHVYTFRGWATDLVGHLTDPVVQRAATVPLGATGPGGNGGANHAPVVQLLQPPSGPQHGTVTVRVAASDPDGTTPILTASLVPARGSPVVLASGTGTVLSLDTQKVPDGSYTLRVAASDGALGAKAEAPFVVDNHGPTLAGPKPAPDAAGGVLLLVEGDDALTVLLTLQKPGQQGVQSMPMHDDGTHGDAIGADHIFTAQVFGFAPGTYLATVTATDAGGNSATHIQEVQVPPPYTPRTVPFPQQPSRHAPTPPAGPPEVQAPHGILGLPGFEPALLALAVLGGAWAARRRKQA